MAPTSYTLLLDPINAVLPPSPAAQPLARRAPGRSGAYGASAPNFLNSGRQKFALTENVPHEVVQQYRRGLVHTDSHTLGRRASLEPTDTQKVTLGVIGAYIAIIAILWNIPYVKWVLYPLKMLTIAFHEFGHAATGCCTGAKIKSITLDPREGGATMMAGGISAITLPAGYLGSSLIGAVLTACGFNIVASKVCSIALGVSFLLVLWWGRKDWLTIGTILFSVGLMVAFWFIAHGTALRFFVLFMGVMSSLYSVWDIDDLILRKVNESDASVFAKRYGGSSACWGVIWAIISLAFMVAGILVGLVAFKQDFSAQANASKDFLPTRLFF